MEPGKLQLICLLIAVCLVRNSVSYFVTVDAYAEECFFDKVEAGTKMGEFVIFAKIKFACFTN